MALKWTIEMLYDQRKYSKVRVGPNSEMKFNIGDDLDIMEEEQID